ncbi:MAG: hypothetical protein ACYDAG_06820 [Chloroflexota bacterium]
MSPAAATSAGAVGIPTAALPDTWPFQASQDQPRPISPPGFISSSPVVRRRTAGGRAGDGRSLSRRAGRSWLVGRSPRPAVMAAIGNQRRL